jgi:ABC-2 type transport system ATP-binding protein
MYAIETENLYKSYDSVNVLKGLSLRVSPGQVYGLLGPNGSGKSTLLHLLLGFLKPSKGTVQLFGEHDIERVRGRIGYLPERLRYHLRYTGREYLRYLGRFSDLSEPELSERVEQELEAVRLTDAADRMLSTYSKGMLQRLGIAQALLSDPEILLIDEPTSGLDPAGQREMLDLLAEVRRRNHTIFLTTHYLDEIDVLCDTVGILYAGKLAAELDVQTLRVPGRNVLITVDQLPLGAVEPLQSLPGVRCKGREIALQPNTPTLQAQVLGILLKEGIAIISLAPQERPLEDIYMRIVRGEPGDLPAQPSAPSRFAPPRHPDLADVAPNSAPPDASAPATPPPDASAPATPPLDPSRRRSRNGETLLRELLRRRPNAEDNGPPE